MATFNKVIILGNLTRDPDLRGTQGGSSVCELGIAVNRKFTVNGQEKEETLFIDVVIWGKMAEVFHRNLAKGSQVLIEGRLTMDQWQDRNTGERRRKLLITAENIQFIGSRNQSQEQQPPGNFPQNNGIDPGYGPGGGYGEAPGW